MLNAPIRDTVGLDKHARAQELAQMTSEELERGVWSDFVLNYTHAGLCGALEGNYEPSMAPTAPARCRQALALTCDRLLLFNAANWTLVQVIAIAELVEVVLSSYSDTLLLLRLTRTPDVILDLPDARSKFLDELQLAVTNMARRWGGSDFGETALPVIPCSEALVPLQDDRRRRVGTIAFVETGAFLLLTYAPMSLLLDGGGGDTFHFGLLDVQRRSVSARGTHLMWDKYMFILKSGVDSDRRLVWCQHPNDTDATGSVALNDVKAVDALDSPQGDLCIVVSPAAPEASSSSQKLTLRSKSPRDREEWLMAITAMMQLGH